MEWDEDLYDTFLGFEIMNEFIHLDSLGVAPYSLPYVQAFLEDFTALYRTVFPDKPMYFSVWKTKEISYIRHLVQAGDWVQLHYDANQQINWLVWKP